MDKPMGLRQIAKYLEGEGSGPYQRARRAVLNGELPGAYKVGTGTSMWLVPPESVRLWLSVDAPEMPDADV